MRRITDIKECHCILLDIAKEFAEICDKHHIEYFMLGGTMLGAVRHKGFIPWDDDMDFGVMRKDYDRLQKILKDELHTPYKLYTWENTKIIIGQISKIADDRTVVNEIFKEGFEPIGINIDIFPLDFAKSDGKRFDKHYLSNLIKKIYGYKYLPTNSRPLPKKIIALAVKIFLFWMTKQLYVSLVTKLDTCKSGNFVANNDGAWGLKETMSKDIFAKTKKYQFEDTIFNGVADYDSYLSHLYGDYMQLPPESKRHIHLTGLYWK